VPAGAPRLFAICAAVWPFPYRFETSFLPLFDAFAAVAPLLAVQVALEPVPPPVEHDVPFAVALVGFVPDWPDVFWVALPVPDWLAVAVWDLPAFPLPFPWPFPARAEAVNVARAKVSTSAPTMPVKRLLISFSPRGLTTVDKDRYGLQTAKTPVQIRQEEICGEAKPAILPRTAVRPPRRCGLSGRRHPRR
jgi:hypothetical protein